MGRNLLSRFNEITVRYLLKSVSGICEICSGPGAEKIAASWAEKNGVHQVVCKPDWGRDGKAAPFRRNDVLLNFLLKGLVAFPGSGITNNMVDKARKVGIPVLLAAA